MTYLKFITLTSQWARWLLKSPASGLFTQLFIQVQIKENTKASRHWPLCVEFTGTGEFPAQRASYAENVSIWWRHNVNQNPSVANKLIQNGKGDFGIKHGIWIVIMVNRYHVQLWHTWMYISRITNEQTTTNGGVKSVTQDDVIKWKHFPWYWPGHRWIPLTKVSAAELWCFLWFAPEQTVEYTIVTLMIWDSILLIMTSL